MTPGGLPRVPAGGNPCSKMPRKLGPQSSLHCFSVVFGGSSLPSLWSIWGMSHFSSKENHLYQLISCEEEIDDWYLPGPAGEGEGVMQYVIVSSKPYRTVFSSHDKGIAPFPFGPSVTPECVSTQCSKLSLLISWCWHISGCQFATSGLDGFFFSAFSRNLYSKAALWGFS